MPIYSRHFEIYPILTPRLCIDMVLISCLSLERVETVSKLSARGRRGWIRWQRGSRSTCNLPVGGFPQPASSSSDTRSQGGTELDHKLEHPGRSEYVEAIRSGCSDRRPREVYCFERVQTPTAPPPAAPLVWMVYCLNEAAVFKPPEGSLDKRAPSLLLPIPQGISLGYLEIDATSRGRDLNLSWGEVCQDSDAWKRRIWSVLY